MTTARHGSRGEAHLEALGSSVRRLRLLVDGLSDDDLDTGAYPSRWSVAGVLSHIGSGAVVIPLEPEAHPVEPGEPVIDGRATRGNEHLAGHVRDGVR